MVSVYKYFYITLLFVGFVLMLKKRKRIIFVKIATLYIATLPYCEKREVEEILYIYHIPAADSQPKLLGIACDNCGEQLLS